MLGSIQTHFWAVRDYLSPVLRDSKFKETGRLTPEEFVAAGDFLTYKFPTWTWESGEPSKVRDFLPRDKQYLISRNVPCLRRVSQLGQQGGAGDDYAEMIMNFAQEEGLTGSTGGEDDEWVATHTNSNDPNSTTDIPVIGEIPDLEPSTSTGETADELTNDLANASLREEDIPDMDEIPDMDDLQGNDFGLVGGEEEDDDAVVNIQPSDYSTETASDNLVQVRTYDCMITYDKYYQTPRMWLLGYDEQKRPLPPQSALSDVSSDHALKTVTIEPFPHSSSLSIASVHPCKHSNVMKRFIERMDRGVRELQQKEAKQHHQQQQSHGQQSSSSSQEEGATTKKEKSRWFGKNSTSKRDKAAEEGEELVEGLRVDQYLVVFLKFMSSIVPTIEVDSTTNI